MKFAISQIKDIILSIFSEAGYNIQNFNVKFPQPLDINIAIDKDNNVNLNFAKNLPKVSWKRFITLSALVQRITLGPTSGALKLKYLPDIKFSYGSEASEHFSFNGYILDDISEDIEKEYSDTERKKIAYKCLHYASEWATIASNSGINFSECSSSDKKKLKKDCKSFVTENIKNDPEIKAGSVILGFLFFYVVLPVILKFILERIFNKLFQ